MCDDVTEAENEAYLAATRLNRRTVGIGVGAVLSGMVTGCSGPTVRDTTPPDPVDPPPPPEPPPATGTGTVSTSRMVTVDTPDGSAEAMFVMPAKGKHPGVIMWPDVAGFRDAYKKMATRLAGEGYAVLVPNPYYRSSKLPILSSLSEWRTDEGRAKIRPMAEALTAEAVTRDGLALTEWLDAQPEVDTSRKLAAIGYCMSGSFTFRAAAATHRIGAIASFHGGSLVTDEPTSVHLLFPKMQAAALICIAQNDDQRAPDAKTTLQAAADQASITAEVEVYPANHGWCTLDAPVYDEPQAERAWSRMLSIFGNNV